MQGAGPAGLHPHLRGLPVPIQAPAVAFAGLVALASLGKRSLADTLERVLRAARTSHSHALEVTTTSAGNVERELRFYPATRPGVCHLRILVRPVVPVDLVDVALVANCHETHRNQRSFLARLGLARWHGERLIVLVPIILRRPLDHCPAPWAEVPPRE